MKKYLELIRVKHWIKNILIFIPIIFSKHIINDYLFRTICGFFSFSLGSSFIYILNDIKDIEKDKLHPRKQKRPLPSGKIKKSTAVIFAVGMFCLSILVNVFANGIIHDSLYFLLIYMVINICYSFGLKDIAIIDIVLLASGFVLRVYYGATIINVSVSNWLFLTIMSASLFLGFGKRKKELINNYLTRKVLFEYTENFLNNFQYLSLTLTIVFYSLWTIEQEIEFLNLTIPMLIVIFMRYSLDLEKNNEGDPVTVLYQDKLLIFICLIYGITMLLLVGV